MSRRRQHAMRLVVLGALAAGLTFAALWRVSSPPAPPSGAGETTAAIARQTTIEAVEIRAIPSPRTLWVGSADNPTFVVLDPDVKRTAPIALQAGSRVTLVGLRRDTPAPDVAMRQWGIDEATAMRVAALGEYVYATEIR